MIKLEENEKILFAARKHWFVLFGETLFLLGLIFLPVLIYIGLHAIGALALVQLPGDPVYLVIAALSLWLLFIWITFFIVWTDYYLDILILTSRRVVDIQQKRLFSREVSTFRLDRIQDITVEVNGIIQTFLHFGKIHIQTAGERQDFVVYGIPRPYDVKDKILHAANMFIEAPRDREPL